MMCASSSELLKEKWEMLKKLFVIGSYLSFFFLALFQSDLVFSQGDEISKVAIETVKKQIRLPAGTEIRFIEKKESQIPGFSTVKLVISSMDKDMPVVLYVNQTGEKVILGNLFVNGENVTAKEAGSPTTKKIDMAILDIDRSPSIGPRGARVTIVEFSNFQCPHCMDSWTKLKPLLVKSPKEVRYVFKHFPFQSEGKPFELSEMAAAAQEVSSEAFWLLHDFFFTAEGQNVAKLEKKLVQTRVEQILREKKVDVKAFLAALESGKGRQRVVDDRALGNKLRITGTPTKVVNGDIIVGSTADSDLEKYLAK
jgi:protein-disulfide isomerase